MSENYPAHEANSTPPRLLPLMQKLKAAYLFWFDCYQTLPKTHRYSLGEKVDRLLIDAIEAVAAATYAPRQEKLTYVRLALRKVDAFKIMLLILWETKSLGTKKYAALSVRVEEIGRMLGGWNGQIMRQNSPDARPGEK